MLAKGRALFQRDVPHELVRRISIRGKNQDFLGGCLGFEPRTGVADLALIRRRCDDNAAHVPPRAALTRTVFFSPRLSSVPA